MSSVNLTARERAVLMHAIQAYLATGEPVASRAVLSGSELGISAATVRSVMATLEARGLLMQPHTSAGRVPTVSGIQLYVAALVWREPVDKGTERMMRESFEGQTGVDGLLLTASRVLSGLSSMAGLASSPKADGLRLEHIKLMGLSEGRLLAVVVAQGARVSHQIVEVGRVIPPSDLERMNNFLNQTVVGLTLGQARARLREDVRGHEIEADEVLRAAAAVARSALHSEDPVEVVVEGELNLLRLEAFGDLERATQALQALREKRLLLDILSRVEDTPGAHVLVDGLSEEGELGAGEALGCSLIVAPYGGESGRLGWVGVVGPVRMHYGALIPLVECAASAVSRRLREAMVA